MNELFTTLVSWAVTLSGYPMPAVQPEVVMVPHSFFVKNACGGRECKVYGWYAGGRKIYLDERMDPENDLLADSVIVHESVHYLQGIARGVSDAAFGQRPTCADAIEMEREAYQVQRAFLLAYGVYQPVGMSMLRSECGSAK